LPFAHLGLAPEIVRGVKAVGYTDPTPIQTKAIPPILEGRDLIGCAQTGTGKTAAFVLPILHILRKHEEGVRALVLTPTRELAAQVETAVRDYSRFTNLRCGVVYGGVSIGPQESRLKEGVDILVATPGRLLDHMERGNVFFTRLRVLVLDEADRMVDMGFAPDLNRILRKVPAGRQTLMFSATMPPDLNAIAKKALVEPARVDVAPRVTTAAGIRQAIYPVPQHLKTELLVELLEGEAMTSVLVFARTKHGADKITRDVERRGIGVACLHSNRTQGQRERALQAFRSGQVSVLIATDIASRGLDVEGISHVVNYDVPHQPEDYVHRVGRTARAEALGDAFTFMSREEESLVTAIEKFTGKAIPRVTIPDFDYKRAAPPRAGRGGEARGGRGAGPRRGGGAGRGHERGRGSERARGGEGSRAGRGHGGESRPSGNGARGHGGRAGQPHAPAHSASRPSASGHASTANGPAGRAGGASSGTPAAPVFGRTERKVNPFSRRRR
jgi:ATP-dependent RNA helicase RhlE